ncbi:hypothetical protein BD413DRAFT_156055 [Trametes elegans]|nr:hypothetical protein BD413DRAFT_156055 [Trametes elegans]
MACCATARDAAVHAGPLEELGPQISPKPPPPCSGGTPAHPSATSFYRMPLQPRTRASSFRRSNWFRRGLTLQELVVSSKSVFLQLDNNWRTIGTKESLASVIEEVAGVDQEVSLKRRPPQSISVACGEGGHCPGWGDSCGSSG